jgi:hypothetical protein
MSRRRLTRSLPPDTFALVRSSSSRFRSASPAPILTAAATSDFVLVTPTRSRLVFFPPGWHEGFGCPVAEVLSAGL